MRIAPKFKFLSALLTFPLVLSSCNLPNIPFLSGKTPIISNAVTINYWGLFESSDVMNPLIQEYERAHPGVHINYEQKDFSDLSAYKDTVLSRLENNTAPDIVRVHSTWVSDFYKYLAPAPTSVYTKENFEKEFYPSAVQTSVSSKGLVYAVPLMFEALVVFYNQDALSKIGVSHLPRTWDDFRDLAKNLTVKDDKGNILRAGAAMGNSYNLAHASDILGLMLSQSNLKIPDDLDTDAAAKVLDYYVGFYKNDGVWDSNLPYSPISFSQGKVVMMFAPTWQSFSILKENPNFGVGIAAVPQIPIYQDPGITDVNWANFWVEVVSSGSKNKEAAWDFLKFLSQKEQRDKLFQKGSRIRPFGNAFGLNKLSETLQDNDYITNVVLGAPFARTGLIVDRVGNDDYVKPINDAIESVINGATSKGALLKAKQEILKAKEDNLSQPSK